MGAFSFLQTGTGKKACEVFARLQEDTIYEYGNDTYNGTISTTSLVKTTSVAEKYSEASRKKGYKLAEELLESLDIVYPKSKK